MSSSPTALCGAEIKVIPDFLLDHTLPPDTLAARLAAHGTRWVQFLQRLWSWDGATFCLRFAADPTRGRTRMYLLARPPRPEDREALQRDIEFALMAYGVVPDVRDPARCVRLGDAAVSQALRPLPETACTVAVAQQVVDSLWSDEASLDQLARAFNTSTRTASTAGAAPPRVAAWVPHLWEGPTGPYLVPFQAMAAARGPTCVSIFIQPYQLDLAELRWLRMLEKVSSLAVAGNNDLSRVAELINNMTTRAYARLLPNPWLVAVHCTSPGGDACDARSVAASVRSLCLESAGPPSDDPAAPFPAAVLFDAPSVAAAKAAHVGLAFPAWAPPPSRPESPPRHPALLRLNYLADARGVATVFRLPVSVRGGVPMVDVEQPSPDFHPGPRFQHYDAPDDPAPPAPRDEPPARTVRLGRYESGGRALLDVEQLRKHCLVTGFTGSGKTTTLLNLVHQLWHDHGVPFLVIEAAKREYRGLLRVPAFGGETPLLVYTLGDETTAPFRLNPFMLLPGVRVEAHIGRLIACFEAALPPLPWLPSMLAEALEQTYLDAGWTLTDACEPDTRHGRRAPTMRSFYRVLGRVVAARKYGGDTGQNVRAATLGRVKQLLLGSVGFMLGADEGENVDLDLLFQRPVVLELNDLNLQDKALMMTFLLTYLREYRETHKSPTLAHLTIVEEAHNVLGQVESQGTGEGAGADTRAKSVEAFCNLLAEVRALGEGLVIADQSPNKLAPDAMRNTNVQIAHQLRDENDRQAIANAMIMDAEQRDFLGKLPPGRAAVFFTGLQKATFLTAPNYHREAGRDFADDLPDGAVRTHMDSLVAGYRRKATPFDGCRLCPVRRTCDHRPAILAVMPRIDAFDRRGVRRGFATLAAATRAGDTALRAAVREDLARRGRLYLDGEPVAADPHAAWCFLLHAANRPGAPLPRGARPDRDWHGRFVARYRELADEPS